MAFRTLCGFCTCTMESVLTVCITATGNLARTSPEQRCCRFNAGRRGTAELKQTLISSVTDCPTCSHLHMLKKTSISLYKVYGFSIKILRTFSLKCWSFFSLTALFRDLSVGQLNSSIPKVTSYKLQF